VKLVSILLAVAAMISGMMASWRWYNASVLAQSVAMHQYLDAGPRPNFLDNFAIESAKSNARAAIWTLAATMLAAASSLVGSLT
jgi:hypothetical protein